MLFSLGRASLQRKVGLHLLLLVFLGNWHSVVHFQLLVVSIGRVAGNRLVGLDGAHLKWLVLLLVVG